jgi:hypothetical protein
VYRKERKAELIKIENKKRKEEARLMELGSRLGKRVKK